MEEKRALRAHLQLLRILRDELTRPPTRGHYWKSRNLWKQQIENIHFISSNKHDLRGSFGDLSRPVSHSLSNTRKKIQEKKETKK